MTEQSSATKRLEIKERKISPSLKDGMFRMAFDLAGFAAEDIQVVVSEETKIVYIEAKRQAKTTDGSKSSREFSFECQIEKEVDVNTLKAYLDNEGLLVIEGDSAKQTLPGVTKKD